MPLTCEIYFLGMLCYEFEILSLVTIISISKNSFQSISICRDNIKLMTSHVFAKKHRFMKRYSKMKSNFVSVPTWTYQITFCIIIFSFCNFSSIPKIHGEHTTLLLLRMDSLRTCDIHTHIYIAELMHNKWVMQIALGQKGMPTNIWSQILVKFVFLNLSISLIVSANFVFNALLVIYNFVLINISRYNRYTIRFI